MSPPPKRSLITRARQVMKPGTKIGMTDLGNRAVADIPAAQPDFSAGANRTQMYTYLTQVGGQPQVLYSGDRLWARVKLTLETGGPVVVGQQSKLFPITSGIGVNLQTGVEREFTIAKGTQLYIASTAVNSVAVVVEPLPWLEQIAAFLKSIAGL